MNTPTKPVIWTDDAIDQFLSTKRRKTFIMTGFGKVREADTTTGQNPASLLTAHCDGDRVSVVNYDGQTVYVGFKDR